MENKLPQPRLHYIDWLRVLAVLLLIPFHSALVFNPDPNAIVYVKDIVRSPFLCAMTGVIHQFHMPLLFVLSGMSTCLALGFRSGRQYIRERINRLLIPFLFTVIVLIPPMTWLTRLWRGNNITFWQHFLGFFRLNTGDLSGLGGTLTPAHAWFIMYLFIFSISLLDAFLSIRKNKHTRLEKFFSAPFAILLPGLLLTLASAVDILGDKNPIVYCMYFFFGFMLMTGESYMKAIGKIWPYLLPVGVVFLVLTFRLPDYREWSLPWILTGIMENSNRWILALALLGAGERFLNCGGRALKYLSGAAFPVYLLHMPINTLVAFYVIRLHASVAVKYIVIITVTTALSFLVYELVRRVAPIRWLMGIKASKNTAAIQQNDNRHK